MRNRRGLAIGPVLVGAVLMVASCSPAPSPTSGDSSASGPGHGAAILLGHAGRFLTDAAGQVVIVHGLDMVSKVPPYEPAAAGFGAQAARSLAANGFDVVRLGVIWSALEPEPGVFSAAYVDSIGRTVTALAARGVYTLLDFHQDQMSIGFGGEGFPSWAVETDGLPVRKFVFPLGYTSSPALDAAFTNFWEDRSGPGGVGLQERYAAAWRQVASRFAGDPWVLGYDLFNEPWPAQGTDPELGSFYSKVITAIRSVDRTHLIFYEPFVLFDFGQPTSLPRFDAAGLGMSFHDYCDADTSTAGPACARSEEVPVANALTRSASTGDALVETEFGATDDLTDLARVEGAADARGISWIEWSYCGCDDPTGTIPPAIEGLVASPSLPATGTNVDAAKLAVLGEPYPRVTSGTPLAYSFDDATRTMRYTYSVVSPRRHRFGGGSCTAVVVPPAEYPGGYTVTAGGARVTSPSGAGILTLSQEGGGGPGATVTVVVRPAVGGHTGGPEETAITACR